MSRPFRGAEMASRGLESSLRDPSRHGGRVPLQPAGRDRQRHGRGQGGLRGQRPAAHRVQLGGRAAEARARDAGRPARGRRRLRRREGRGAPRRAQDLVPDGARRRDRLGRQERVWATSSTRASTGSASRARAPCLPTEAPPAVQPPREGRRGLLRVLLRAALFFVPQAILSLYARAARRLVPTRRRRHAAGGPSTRPRRRTPSAAWTSRAATSRSTSCCCRGAGCERSARERAPKRALARSRAPFSRARGRGPSRRAAPPPPPVSAPFPAPPARRHTLATSAERDFAAGG